MFSSSSETRRWFWDRLFLAGQHLPLPALFETVQRRRSEANNNTQNTENVPFQHIHGFSSQFNKTSGITVFRYSGKKESLLLSCCYSPLYTNLLKMTKRTKNIKLDVTSCCFDCFCFLYWPTVSWINIDIVHLLWHIVFCACLSNSWSTTRRGRTSTVCPTSTSQSTDKWSATWPSRSTSSWSNAWRTSSSPW